MRDITDIADVKKRFLAYLTLEKGMSQNTAQAYSDDVDKLTRYLADAGIGIEHATTDDLERFVCYWMWASSRAPKHASSVA